MKKLYLFGTVILCIILIIYLYHDTDEYITTYEIIPQAVATSVLGSVIGASFLILLFGDCGVK